MSFVVIEIHCQGNIKCLLTHLLPLCGVPLFDPFPPALVLPHVNFRLLLGHIPGLVSAPQMLMWWFQAVPCAGSSGSVPAALTRTRTESGSSCEQEQSKNLCRTLLIICVLSHGFSSPLCPACAAPSAASRAATLYFLL